MLLLLVGGFARTRRMRARAWADEDSGLAALCERLSAELGVWVQVGVRISDEVAGPVLVGVARPLILLPAAAIQGLSAEQLEMVLLHELAHARRLDNLVQLAQRLIESALFFQPAVWIVSRWIDLEREHCCDAVVLRHTNSPRVYARTLVALAESRSGAPAFALPMAKRPLIERIERILESDSSLTDAGSELT